MQKTQVFPLLYSVLPALMVLCIAGMRFLRHAAERAEAREQEVRDGRFVCEYRERGGMADNDLTLTLTVEADVVKLSVKERLSGEENESIGEYPLPKAAAEPIVISYIDYKIWKWQDLKKSDLVALDAPTKTLRFESALGVTEFDSDRELPQHGAGVFGEVYTSLNGWYDLFRRARQ